jgi:DNA gyrase subunit A
MTPIETENPADLPRQHDGVVPRVIEEEMKIAYITYAMSVIVGRALPDIRDGLKPVHRRILYTMYKAGLLHNKPYRKSAFICGRTMADFHPHGDAAIYDALARMAQDFSLRYPLVKGQGNWGSIDGDKPAASRYTEAKLQKLAEEMLRDIDKNTVDFRDNFDGSLQEPTILPTKIPNLLINGSSGIAVGMATNIPPHNVVEVCDGIIATIDNPDISVQELMEVIPAPDFPTGGEVGCGSSLLHAYTKGRGKVTLKAVSEIVDDKIIISEIPYQVNKEDLIIQIASLVRK